MNNELNDDSAHANADDGMTGIHGRDAAAEVAEAFEFLDTDQWVQVQQTYYDREAPVELATTLAFAIGEARGVDPLDHEAMPPLYEYVDAQALEETFFGPSGAGPRRQEAGAVTFVYEGLRIVLRSDGWLFVYDSR